MNDYAARIKNALDPLNTDDFEKRHLDLDILANALTNPFLTPIDTNPLTIEDPEERHKQLIAFLFNSLCNELKTSPFFPCLCTRLIEEASPDLILKKWRELGLKYGLSSFYPDFNSQEYTEEIAEKVHEVWRIEAIEKWEKVCLDDEYPFQAVIASLYADPYDKGRIEEIKDYKYISLFELAVLIGYRFYRSPYEHLLDCHNLFAEAIVKGMINPRHPQTHLTYEQTPKGNRLKDGIIELYKEAPSLDWELTPKEAAEFASLKGYPAHFFTDLSSDTPTMTDAMASPSRDDKQADTSEISQEVSTNADDDKPLDPREKKALLIIIAALCKKHGIGPCDRGLASELERTADLLGFKISAKTIKRHLDAAGLIEK